MPRKIQFAVAAILLAALSLLVFVLREDRRQRNRLMQLYTQAVKAHDISESAHKTMSFLNDAALREQSYVVTGQTIYSEAYAQDIQNWQDEFGTFQLIAGKGPTGPLIRDLSA